MAKNYMKEIAQMLGVEMDELFYVITQKGKHRCTYSDNDVFKFGEQGLASINNGDGCYEYHLNGRYILSRILTGEYSIEKLPWEPKDGELYYSIEFDFNGVSKTPWHGDAYDHALKALGMIYRTKEEAEAHFAEDYEKLTGKKLSSR